MNFKIILVPHKLLMLWTFSSVGDNLMDRQGILVCNSRWKKFFDCRHGYWHISVSIPYENDIFNDFDILYLL